MLKHRRRNNPSSSMAALSYRNTNPHPFRSIHKALHIFLKRINSRKGLHCLHPPTLRPCPSEQRAHNRKDSLQTSSTRRFSAMAGHRLRHDPLRSHLKSSRVLQSSQCWQKQRKACRIIARLSLGRQGRAAGRRRSQR